MKIVDQLTNVAREGGVLNQEQAQELLTLVNRQQDQIRTLSTQVGKQSG